MPLNWYLWENEGNIKSNWFNSSNANIATFFPPQNLQRAEEYIFFWEAQKKEKEVVSQKVMTAYDGTLLPSTKCVEELFALTQHRNNLGVTY